MKVRRILVLVAAAALAQLGHAKAETEHQAPHPRSLPPVRAKAPNYARLGAEQAVLDFCSKIDSPDGKAYEAEDKIVFAGIREDGIEKARRSVQYQDAYKTIASVLGEIPSHEAVQGCQSVIGLSKPAQASGKNSGGNTGSHGSSNTGSHGSSHTGSHGSSNTPGHGATKGVGNHVKDRVKE